MMHLSLDATAMAKIRRLVGSRQGRSDTAFGARSEQDDRSDDDQEHDVTDTSQLTRTSGC
ncbi:hypothetical protein ACFWAR_19485 [Streptomyces sp. NPDC059917]|uniref:hypothetical protein n=1 Tax=Streptomyces sp. NPDC059917 TaxID=3347002 RepID=UPI003656755A